MGPSARCAPSAARPDATMNVIDVGLVRLYRALEGIGAPLMVGGGVATIHYGEPRTTIDIDVIMDVGIHDAQRIVDALDADAYYVPPLETIEAELRRGSQGQFNIIDMASSMKADIYPAGDDPLARYGLEHVELGELSGTPMRFAPATYVVAMKLRYYGISGQDKHLRDIRGMLVLARDRLDEAAIDAWAQRYGVREAWARCLAAIGDE
jgi:hypothetical protein